MDKVTELRERVELLEAKLTAREYMPFPILYAAPAKPRDGMVCWADGTSWNPGSGAGLYHYRAGAWHYLG